MKKFVALFAFVLLLLHTPLSAQQEGSGALKKISLQLQWKYQFQFAGFIVAKEKGYYKDAGLDVTLLEYNNTDIMEDLEDGKVDYALSNSILLYKEGVLRDTTLLATYFHRSPLVLIVQPNIKSPNDLYGKILMASKNDIYNSTLTLLFDYYGLNKDNMVFLENSFNLDDFIQQKVDAVAAFTSNEVYLLKEKKVPFNIIDPADYGFTTTAINLFTTKERARQNKQEVIRFLEATKKGWEYALENLNETARLIHEKYRPDLSLKHLEYEAKLTKRLMLTNLYEIGEVDENFVQKTLNQLIRKGILKKNQDTDNLIFQQQSNESLEFTEEEKEWMHQHPFITYSEVNWKPLSIIEKGTMQGIMGDYLNLIAQTTGLHFKYVPSKTWSEVLEKFQKNTIELVPGAGSSPQEKALGIMSDVYATYPMVIVTTSEYRFVNSVRDFKDKVIAVPKNYTSYNFLRSKYPHIKLLVTQNIPEALKLVSDGKADAFVGHIAPALYYISKLDFTNLKISGNASFMFEHRFLLHRNDTLLRSIINKALKSITPEQHSIIRSRWMQTTVAKEIDYTLLWLTLALSSLIVLFFYWRHKLSIKHQKETQLLNTRMQMALENSNSGIWDWNIETNEVYLSPSWKKILGYSDEEIPNRFEEWQKRVHPDDLPKVMEEIQNILDGKADAFDNLHRMKHKHGHWVWINDVAKVYRDANGKAVKMSGTHTDVTQQMNIQEKLQEQKAKLDFLAHHDPLTGLANRMLFQERLHKAIKNAKKQNSKVALFFIDLDHFKEINDSLGHAVGDEVLKIISHRIINSVREGDAIARLGGDEFTVIIENFDSVDELSEIAKEVLESLSHPVQLRAHKFYISCSIGISVFPDDGGSVEDLLKYADAAMYKAKQEGRNNFQFYSAEMTEHAFERILMENALRDAIKNKDFIVYYQPQVDALSEEIVGLEALVRWQHETMGLVSPAKFIPLAESTGLIIPLDELVMEMALKDVKKWSEMGIFEGRISINLSAKQLKDTNFLPKLKTIVEQSGCSYERIELEITESEVMNNPQEAITLLEEIHRLGIKLSVDDFGTGYSSLAYLKRLPIDKLKIDRSFIKDLPDDEEDKALTKTIIALAKNLNLDIIAEGIETKEQRDFVVENGCTKIQGYFYYKPLDASSLQKMLMEKSPTSQKEN